ncbi:hypothetical protein Tco_1379187, partial [Tanacetum coccineum]
DFQDSPDDEEDTRSSHEYLNDLEEEYQARTLLAKSKRFFKKGTHRPTKDFEAKYNKVKAKLALLSSNASASKASIVKNKGLIAEAYEWDEEEVSSDNNEMVEVKVLMALAEENDAANKEGTRNDEWVNIPKSPMKSETSGKLSFDEKRGTIFNSNKEVVMIAPRVQRFYIHNHKDHLGKFDEKVDDGYLLGYSLVSKAFRVFNPRRQQNEKTNHITFDESPDAIKFSKPLVDNINIDETERYPLDEYLHPYEPFQRYQTNSNDVSFIEPYEYHELVVLETKVSSDQNGQTDQDNHNYQSV